MHFLPAFLRKKDSKASLVNNLLKKIAQEDALNDKDVFNVVVIGQTGVGASSFINAITGFSQAPVSTDVSPCTKAFTAYPFTLNGRFFRLIDSPGFGSFKCPTSTITKALRELDAQCGIDLVVNCLRGTRGDANAGFQNYTAIRSAVSDDVPIVAVITCLERYGETMNQWWSTNEADLKARRMVFADHACVTTLEPSTTREAMFKDRLSESERAAKQLIMRNCWAEKRGVGRWSRRGDVLLGN
ncbi:P-loop containing nucleoside triphosphate hydrolase protein [Tylopilus felleus]|jgi:predicted GTPase